MSDTALAFGHYLTLRSPVTLGDYKFPKLLGW